MSNPDVDALHEHLRRTGIVVPVDQGGAEERIWLDCDLASLAENRLGELYEPRDLEEARRADLSCRVIEEPQWSLEDRSRMERCYWLVHGGVRTGTIALGTSQASGRSLRITSLYLFPPFRGLGVGRRSLGRIREALARYGFGLRLDTSWCWQRAVRFYLAAGLWVCSWAAELTFFWSPDLPKPEIDIETGSATLSVTTNAGRVDVARAFRRPRAASLDRSACHKESLVLEMPRRELLVDRQLGALQWHAVSTFALALALRGWPLIRSDEAWNDYRATDGGAPEGLAYRIIIWEAWARARGWKVDTPRIVGLRYSGWEELCAQWQAERAAFEEQLSKKAG